MFIILSTTFFNLTHNQTIFMYIKSMANILNAKTFF